MSGPGDATRDPRASWLLRTVSRLALNALQRWRRRGTREADFFESHLRRPLDPMQLCDRERAAEQVRRVLDQLPRRSTRLLWLWAADRPYTEIGRDLEIAPSTIRKALTRARRQFRARYAHACRAAGGCGPRRQTEPRS